MIGGGTLVVEYSSPLYVRILAVKQKLEAPDKSSPKSNKKLCDWPIGDQFFCGVSSSVAPMSKLLNIWEGPERFKMMVN